MNEWWICPYCGHENPVPYDVESGDNLYCDECGEGSWAGGVVEGLEEDEEDA